MYCRTLTVVREALISSIRACKQSEEFAYRDLRVVCSIGVACMPELPDRNCWYCALLFSFFEKGAAKVVLTWDIGDSVEQYFVECGPSKMSASYFVYSVMVKYEVLGFLF